MLRKKLSHLPAAFVLALLVLLIGAVPAGASPTIPVGLLTPGLHGAGGAPGAAPVSGAHGPAAPVHTVPARACSSWTQVKSPSPSSLGNFLLGVVAPTTSFAWAVGFAYSGAGSQTLIVQWNGTSWNQVASPNPSRLNFLYAVAGNAQDAWAVGYSGNGSSQNALIEHWNGTKWSIVPSPSPGILFGVTAVSSSDAWAVGEAGLIEHWNGSSWKVARSPSASRLYGVTAVSSSDAWAVGTAGSKTRIEHWNGSSWRVVPSPSPSASDNTLWGVTGNAQNAWAAGYYYNSQNGFYDTLILQWNGTSWARVSSPNPSQDNALYGVAGDTKNAWAVGDSLNPSSDQQTLTEQWNGSSWNVVASPNPPAVNVLMGVAQIGNKGGHFWAVGYSGTDTLILQC